MTKLGLPGMLYLGLVLAGLGAGAGAAEPAEAVRSLIARLVPGHSTEFVLEPLAAAAGENVFEVDARAGKIVLRGDSPLSLAVAFNWYLKHDAFIDVSWYADDPIKLPAQLPLPKEAVHRSTRTKDRFFLNYCTFGYSTPFWRWRDWERLIDWMALNGISLPLAQNGNEAVWQKVWREYGLTDEEIRAYFTGPGYLPWHRMSNIDHWDGPLPQSFIDGQRDLQKQILARERALGMSPVLCAFAGHVPEALKTRQPAMKLSRIPPGWGGLTKDYGCWFLDPLDPKFAEIQARFLREQEKEFGTSHYYGTDPFNEVAPPSWEPAYLASVSSAIYRSLAQVDSDAIWLQMAWTFSPPRDKDWTPERLSAMIKAVPAGRMVLIDYHCEDVELFRTTQAFYGSPFIWDYLGNFGGNTYLGGPIETINQRLTAAMNDPALTNCVGVGATLEGLNNQAVYELLFDRVWAGRDLDLARWVREEARARAGGEDSAVEAGWGILGQKIFVGDGVRIHPRGVVFQEANPNLAGKLTSKLSTHVPYDNADLFRAWQSLLQAGATARSSSGYQHDLVDTTRQALGNLGLTLRQQMADAYGRKDAAGFKKASDEFVALGLALDDFLGTRSEFMLGKWIEDARSWAAVPGEEDFYEKDARSLITIWAGRLIDYAGRQWNGLMRDYYLPRWQELIDATQAELTSGKPVDLQVLQAQWRDHDLNFARSAGGKYAAQPQGDYFAMSRDLFQRYSPLPRTGVAAEATAAHPNVLFIVADDMNTSLGCYGNPTVKSPNLDRIAANGVRFDHAYCQYPLCNPSRVSFLSGRRPENTGVYMLSKPSRKAIPDAVMLPQFFREQGYYSAGAGKVYHTFKMSDPRSWDYYEDGDGNDPGEAAALKARYSVGADGRPAWTILNSDGSQTQDGLSAQIICRLMAEQNKAGKRFFLAAGFHKPHLPWTAPKRFFDLYPPGSIPVSPEPAMKGIPAIALQTELSGFPQPSSREAAVRAYYACISSTDYRVGLLLDELKRQGLEKNTVIVFISDNGFHLGDHGGLWSKLSAFVEANRVPFLISGPGVPRGRVVTTPVELLDLYPTLLDLCGFAAPPGLEGRSLVPDLRRGSEAAGQFSRGMVFHYDVAGRKDVLSQSVITDAWRYTEWNGGAAGRELYLHDGDPDEYDNRIDDPAASAILREARSLLQSAPVPKPGQANRPRALTPPGLHVE